MSNDGRLVVGHASGVDGRHAFRWDEATGVQSPLATGSAVTNTMAHGVRAHGKVIVGFIQDAGEQKVATLWDEAVAISLRIALTNRGVSVPEGWALEEAVAVSADSRMIVGVSGYIGAWLAVLGQDCTSW